MTSGLGYTDAMAAPDMASSPATESGLQGIGQSINVLMTAAGVVLVVVGFVAFGLWLCGRCSARSAHLRAAAQERIDAKPGLSKEAIARIPTIKAHDQGLTRQGTSDCCAICLGEFNIAEESIRVLPQCSHCFHVDCIDKWLLSHKTCPTCRLDLSSLEQQQEEPVTVVVDSNACLERMSVD